MRSFLGIVSQSFKMSIQNILSNKMRSFLTMLGIIIGVASVIGLITIVKGATDSFVGEFSSMGAGTIQVVANGNSMKKGLTDTEVEDLKNIKGVEKVSPETNFETVAVLDGEVYKKVTVNGTNTDAFSNKKLFLGRPFLESESKGDTMVCVVDQLFVEKVLVGHKTLGTKINLAGYTYTIIGVMKKDESLLGGFSDDSNSNGSVYIPIKNALTIQGQTNVTNVIVYIEDGVNDKTVQAKLRDYLNKIYNKDEYAYYIISMDSLIESMNSITGVMSGLLGGIASIALVVGGIGIMNMMLVSVSERTKEIGLRKALGAEPARIQLQFLIESIVLSLVGGIIGIILGLGIAAIGALLMKSQFKIIASAIYIGLGFSIGVGVLFGWMPAKKASNLNPIDALRSE